MLEDATYYLSLVKDVDVITYGHSHALFPSEKYKGIAGVDVEKGSINGVAAVQSKFWGSHIGVIDLELAKQDDGTWLRTGSQSRTVPIFSAEGKEMVALVEADKQALALVKADHRDTIRYMKRKIGISGATMDSYFAQVADSASVQIVNEAQVWYGKKIVEGTEHDNIPVLSAIAPFKTGYGGSEDYIAVKKGRINYGNVADLYLYPNTVSILKLTGKEIKEWLERSALAFNQIDPNGGEQQLINNKQPSYNFDVIDGVTYKIDVTQPLRYNAQGTLIDSTAHRIQELQYQGQPIDEAAEFLLVINNYRAGGGGSFPGANAKNLIINAPDENRAAVTSYILEKKRINPKADQNWTIVRNFGSATVIFQSTLKAKKKMPAGIEWLREGEFKLK